MFWIYFVYWLHWGLDILFAVACLSIIFHPWLWARFYVLGFLAQQLILNGCLMSMIQNRVEQSAGWYTTKNQFIMAEVFNGPVVTVYKVAFLIVIAFQVYYIIKEIQWKKNKAA